MSAEEMYENIVQRSIRELGEDKKEYKKEEEEKKKI